LVEILRRALSERAPNVLDAPQPKERMTGELPRTSLAEIDQASSRLAPPS
jgi:hypothetical protein